MTARSRSKADAPVVCAVYRGPEGGFDDELGATVRHGETMYMRPLHQAACAGGWQLRELPFDEDTLSTLEESLQEAAAAIVGPTPSTDDSFEARFFDGRQAGEVEVEALSWDLLPPIARMRRRRQVMTPCLESHYWLWLTRLCEEGLL